MTVHAARARRGMGVRRLGQGVVAAVALNAAILPFAHAQTPPAIDAVRRPAPATSGSLLPRLDHNIQCVVDPSLETNVGTPVDGVLEVVKVDRGDVVQSGQLLAQLSSGVQSASVDFQRAKTEFLGRKLARNKDMDKHNLIAAQELDEVATEERLAELELRERREQLRLRSLVSPIRGVIVDRYRQPGDLVKQERIFRIAQLDPLYAEAILPAHYFGRVKPGQTHAVRLLLSAVSVKATVSTVDRMIDSASGTFRVRLVFPNPNFELPAGQRCAVNF